MSRRPRRRLLRRSTTSLPLDPYRGRAHATAVVNRALRLATDQDIPALEALIPLSVRALQAEHYSPAQMEAALGPVFGADRELIADGTYFVVTCDGALAGCGGWSRRQSLFGGTQALAGDSVLLDPARDSARIRAFFVHPQWARLGIGRCILRACEAAIAAAGFRNVALVATLAGEPLYASFAYVATRRYELPLPEGLSLPVVHMAKVLAPMNAALETK
jgi:GNAT superfamily N-acetyltransferase